MKKIIKLHFGSIVYSNAFLALMILSGCTLQDPGKSRVQISLPPDASAQLSSSAKNSSLNRLPISKDLSGSFLVGTSDPQAPTDFTCFGINVTGAGIANDPTIDACTIPDMPAPGLVGGFSSISGGTIELDVPTGTSRTIQLFAVQSNIGCPAFTSSLGGKFGSEDLGTPYEIGRTVTDIAGDIAVSIDAKWDPLNPKKMFCPKGVGVPYQIVLAGSSTVITSDCTPLKAEVRDSKGDLVSLRSDLTITLSDSDIGSFYSDQNCSIKIDKTATITAKTSSTSIYYKAGSALSHSVSVTAPGIDGSKLAILANVPPPTRLVISSSSTVIAGACSAIQLTAQDQYGVASPVLGDTTAQLQITSGSGSFYSDSICSSSLATATSALISTGKSSVAIYFKANSSSLVSLSAADSKNILKSGTLSFQVNPGVPYQLVFNSPLSSTAVAGTLFGVQPQVQVQDMYGNLVSTISTANVPSVTLSVYTDSNCTTADTGTINATENPKVALSGTAAFAGVSFNYSGTKYIKASATGLVSACSSAISISPAAPSSTNSTISLTPNAPVLSDGTTQGIVTITLKDAFNNPIPGTSATFSASGTSNTLGQPASVTDASGVTTGTITSTVAETKTLSITSPSGLSAVTGNAIFAMTAPAVTYSSITASGSAVADGTASVTVTIVLKDNAMNPTPGYTPVFSASGTGNTIGSCTVSDASGTSICTLKSTVAETKTLQIVSPISMTGGTVTFTAGPPTRLVFLTQPSSSGVAGTPFATQPVVGLVDANGNSATGSYNVYLSVSTSAGCTNNVGSIKATTNPVTMSSGMASFSSALFRSPGVYYLRAQALGLQPACSSSINLSPSGAYIAQFVGPTVVTSSTVQPMKVTILDSEAKPFNVTSPTIVNIGSSPAVVYSDSAGTTSATSVTVPTGSNSAVFYFKYTGVMGISLSFSSSGLQGSSQLITVVNSQNDVSNLNITGPQDIAVGSCSGPFTIQTVNSNRTITNVTTTTSIQVSPTAGTVSFYTDAACTTALSTATISPGYSSTTFYAKPTLAGIVQYLASDMASFLQPADSGFSAANTTGVAAHLSFFDGGHQSAQGCNDVTLIARGLDYRPIQLSAATSILLSSTGSGSFYSDSNCTTPISSVMFPAGASMMDIRYRDNVVEGVTLSASDTSNAMQPASISMMIGPNNYTGNPYRIDLFGFTSPLAVGTCQAFQLKVKTSNWVDTTAPITESFTVNVASGATARLYSAAGCTTGTTSLSVSVPSGANLSNTFWFNSTANEDIQITAVSGNGDFPTNTDWYFLSGNGSGTAQAPTRLQVNGITWTPVDTGCLSLTVGSTDNWGRPSNVSTSVPILMSMMTGLTGQFYLSPGCSTGASSSASISIAPSTNSSSTFYFRATGGTYGFRYLDPVPQSGTYMHFGQAVCGSDSSGNGC